MTVAGGEISGNSQRYLKLDICDCCPTKTDFAPSFAHCFLEEDVPVRASRAPQASRGEPVERPPKENNEERVGTRLELRQDFSTIFSNQHCVLKMRSQTAIFGRKCPTIIILLNLLTAECRHWFDRNRVTGH